MRKAPTCLDASEQARLLVVLRDAQLERGLGPAWAWCWCHDLAAVRKVADQILVLDAAQPACSPTNHPPNPPPNRCRSSTTGGADRSRGVAASCPLDNKQSFVTGRKTGLEPRPTGSDGRQEVAMSIDEQVVARSRGGAFGGLSGRARWRTHLLRRPDVTL